MGFSQMSSSGWRFLEWESRRNQGDVRYRRALPPNKEHPERREYAAQKEIDEADVGMKEKAEEFVAAGGELYQSSKN